MKQNIATITLAFVLGLLCSGIVSAQVYIPEVNPRILGQLRHQAPQSQPSINGAMLERARNSPTLIPNRNKLLGDALGPVSQDRLNLPPGFTMRPVDPPQGLLPRPLPFPSPMPPMPMPTPDPTPAPVPSPTPTPHGPTLQFGPGGPSVSFGNGPTINIPIGQIGQRLRNRGGIYSPPQVLGYGPHGQIHTGDATVHGSTFAPGRNMSQHNGTAQQVQQPIYDQFGNLTGYQTGTVWQNSITGQQHGNMTRYTPNGTGGVHQSTTMYSTAGGNITPIGN